MPFDKWNDQFLSRRRSRIFIFIFFNFSINFTDSQCVWRLIWIFFTFRKTEQNSISKFQTNFSTHTHTFSMTKNDWILTFFSPNFANFPNPSSLNSLIETKKKSTAGSFDSTRRRQQLEDKFFFSKIDFQSFRFYSQEFYPGILNHQFGFFKWNSFIHSFFAFPLFRCLTEKEI